MRALDAHDLRQLHCMPHERASAQLVAPHGRQLGPMGCTTACATHILNLARALAGVCYNARAQMLYKYKSQTALSQQASWSVFRCGKVDPPQLVDRARQAVRCEIPVVARSHPERVAQHERRLTPGKARRMSLPQGTREKLFCRCAERPPVLDSNLQTRSRATRMRKRVLGCWLDSPKQTKNADASCGGRADN